MKADLGSSGELEEHYRGVLCRLGLLPAQPVVYLPPPPPPTDDLKELRIRRCERWLARNQMWRPKALRKWHLRRKNSLGGSYLTHYSPYHEKAEKRAILLRVCNDHMVTVDEIRGSKKNANLVIARQEIVAAIVSAYPNTGTSAIGRMINRNHGTVFYMLGKLGLRRPRFRPQRRAR